MKQFSSFFLIFLFSIFVGLNAIINGEQSLKQTSNNELKNWTQCSLQNEKSIYDFKVGTLEDELVDLNKFKGHVLLIINVATFCAYTQQYNDFNGLIEKNRVNGQNFSILAFPCNQFLLQEPAKNNEIINGITKVRPGNGWLPDKNLHIFGKIEVNGDNHHPLYEFLKDTCPQTVSRIGKREELMYNPIRVNDITWNFEKFLIDKNGQPRYRFHPSAWNKSETVQGHIDELLKE